MNKKDKYPWIKFFPGDWRNDPKLGMCSPSTRGIWMEIVCIMHDMDRCGEITGTVDQLARLCRATNKEIQCALDELHSTKTADVVGLQNDAKVVQNKAPVTEMQHQCNANVTVINRRMKREYESRISSRERVHKHRDVTEMQHQCNANVTEKKQDSNGDVTVQRLYNNKSIYKNKNNNNSCAFLSFWKLYDKKINRKKCEARWNRLKKSDQDAIMKSLPTYIQSTPDKSYRKHPLTYLNGEGWNDEIVVQKSEKQQIFRKTKTGMYVAYCTKCGNKEFPGNDYQLRSYSACCSAEYRPDDPNQDPEWVANRIRVSL